MVKIEFVPYECKIDLFELNNKSFERLAEKYTKWTNKWSEKQITYAKDPIKFLINNYALRGHTMIFEQIPLSLSVVASISILRELRTYRQTSPLEFTSRGEVKRTNLEEIRFVDYGYSEEYKEKIVKVLEGYLDLISSNLKDKNGKFSDDLDILRDFYPLGTGSHMTMILNLHEFIHILEQRYLGLSGKPDKRFSMVLEKGLNGLKESPITSYQRLYEIIMKVLDLKAQKREYLQGVNWEY